jgi:hypothetical protein
MNDAFNTAVRTAKNLMIGKQAVLASWPAYTGNEDGTVHGSRPNYIYVRYPTAASPAIEVYNGSSGVGLVSGLKIMIGYKAERPDLLQVLAEADGRIEVDSTTTIVNSPLKPHAPQHGFGYSDPVYLLFRQITNLGVFTTTSPFVVTMLPGSLKRTSGDTSIAQQTIDLSAHVPVSGALWTLITINASGVVALTDGVTVPSIAALTPQNIPSTPSGHFRIAAIRLYSGQSLIADTLATTDIYDLRWPQEVSASGSGGGATPAISVLYFNSIGQSSMPSSVCYRMSESLSGGTNFDVWGTSLDPIQVQFLTDSQLAGVVEGGVYSATIKAKYDSLSPSNVRIYYKLYAATNDGSGGIVVGSLLGTSVMSANLTASLADVSLTCVVAPAVVSSNTYLLLQYYADIDVGQFASIEFEFDGTTGARLIMPSPTAGFIQLADSHIFVGNGGIAADVAMSGDATIAPSGALTLANTTVAAGVYGSATKVVQITVDSKGRLTSATEVTISTSGGEVVMADGMTPPDPMQTEDETDWLYAG